MRAAIVWESGKTFDVRNDVKRRTPLPHEVAVRIRAASICHTDIALSQGQFGQRFPVVLGHEGAGEVLECGAQVSGFAPGDRVGISWVPVCGRCYFCLHHQQHLCTQRHSTSHAGDTAADVFRIDGRSITAGMGTGTFAEETVVPADALVRIPDFLPFDVAALIGCAVSTGAGAVYNSAEVRPGESVLVIGCGPVGLSAVKAARMSGAASVVALDPLGSRRKAARQAGATAVFDPSETQTTQQLMATPGFDVSIDAVGQPSTIRQGWDLARRGGRIVIVGAGKPDDTVGFSPYELFHSGKTLKGSFYSGSNIRTEFHRLSGLWSKEHLDLGSLITKVTGLEAINEAIELQRSGEAIKVVLEP
jgi:S-(hydroxymethyl)glutathione dehydrogenase/alcohol dehydrogenase